MRVAAVFSLAWLGFTSPGLAAGDLDNPTLPILGPAPEYALIAQDGAERRLSDLRGKVVAVAFIYTWCPDVCGLLTDKMAAVQEMLGASFGKEVAFVSITFDPERDTVEVLKDYAEVFGADPSGWFFLTGEVGAVREVASNYGVITIPVDGGMIGHNLVTTLVDRDGRMRVQYLGHGFDLEEFHHDLTALIAER